MRASRLLPAIAAGSLLIAACGSGSADDASSAPEPAATAAAEPTSEVEPATTEPDAASAADQADDQAAEPTPDTEQVIAPAALQFTAPLVGGGALDATTLAGKPTLFWFWAPT